MKVFFQIAMFTFLASSFQAVKAGKKPDYRYTSSLKLICDLFPGKHDSVIVTSAELRSLPDFAIISLLSQALSSGRTKESIMEEMNALPDPLLARVLNQAFDPLRSVNKTFIDQLYATNPERVRRMLVSLEPMALQDHKSSYGYPGIHLLHLFLWDEDKVTMVDGLKHTERVLHDERVTEMIESIRQTHPDYARALKIRHEFRKKNPGKSVLLNFKEISDNSVDQFIDRVFAGHLSTAAPKTAEAARPPLVTVNDGQIAMFDFASRGNIQIQSSRADSFAIVLRDKTRNASIVAVMDSTMDFANILDQIFGRASQYGFNRRSSEVIILRGSFQHINAGVAAALDRAVQQKFKTIQLMQVEGGLRDHDLRFYGKSGQILNNESGASPATSGFEISKGEAQSRLVEVHNALARTKETEIKIPKGAEKLDRDRDGTLSIDELQVAPLDQLKVLVTAELSDGDLRILVQNLIKINAFQLGRLLLQEFDPILKENLLQELYYVDPNNDSVGAEKLVRVIMRVQEHPLTQDGETNTREGRNAASILKLLDPEQVDELLTALLAREPNKKNYVENIRRQLESGNTFEATSSFDLETFFKPKELRADAFQGQIISYYQARAGQFALTNRSETPSPIVFTLQPERGEIAIIIEGEANEPNLFAYGDLATNGGDFVNAVLWSLQRAKVNKTRAKVRIYGNAELQRGAMSSLARRFKDEKFQDVVEAFNTTERGNFLFTPITAQIFLLDKRTVLPGDSSNHPTGLKITDPKAQSEIDIDSLVPVSRFGKIKKAIGNCLAWFRSAADDS